MSCPGSSPRVRGKRPDGATECKRRRIIPASAGQTQQDISLPVTDLDHPRECGANLPLSTRVRRVGGSSPRVRGKLSKEREALQALRIIPASAGQTSCRHAARPASTDHPRECGANGTSPARRSMRSDHPRECGANPRVRTIFFDEIGSSPRVRGKLMTVNNGAALARIIPASAGQTPPPSMRNARTSDHPRECGANSPALLTNHTLRMPEKFNLHTRYEYHRNLLETTLPDPPHRCTNHNSSVVLSISYLE